eukprot:Hpha_TRINITY_DN15164_c5_g2::TRINITY_DN15164_c5_g2_i1::g.129377::m.129377/K18592/GGT1_5, CD224; gamma-glutamyltranspeptidase / glutathione hydrolase / leukotriene-C4 hydrolase
MGAVEGEPGKYSSEADPLYAGRDGGAKRLIALKLAAGFLAVLALVFMILYIVEVSQDDDDDDAAGGGEDRSRWIKAPEGYYANGAVTSDVYECNVMATDLMRDDGGSAADASVFVALCIGVLHPSSSGVGGGGVATILSPAGPTVFDCRETAPAAADRDMYEGSRRNATHGALAGGVPGEFHCLWEMHQRWGRVPWNTLIGRVATLARNFTVSVGLAQTLRSSAKDLLENDYLRRVFFNGDEPKMAGDFVQWVELADTLDTIAQEGISALYEGSLAQNLSSDILADGGIITVQDLSDYRMVERTPVRTFFHGYELFAAPLPFGGPVMINALNILERYDIGRTGFSSADSQHYVLESMKFAYANRLGLGDPLFVAGMADAVSAMVNKSHAANLRQRITPGKTYPPEHYEDLFPINTAAFEDHGTAHACAADADGLVIAFTTTVNLGFGSKWASPRTGIILNNEMDDFSIPGVNNSFGYPPSPSNFIDPGKRPMSSMTPTIVLDDGLFRLAAGAAGGSRITTATMQVIVNTLVHKMDLATALGAPRVHDQLIPALTSFESAQFPAEVAVELGEMGYNMTAVGSLAVATAILLEDNTDRRLHAAADWRKTGGQSAPNGY